MTLSESGTATRREIDLANKIDGLIKSGDYPSAQKLAEMQFESGQVPVTLAGTHEVLAKLWRELNEYDKLIEQIAAAKRSKVPLDSLLNMQCELVLYFAKAGSHSEAELVMYEVNIGRARTPKNPRRKVDYIVNAKRLLYRNGCKQDLIDSYFCIQQASWVPASDEQHELDLNYWGMLIGSLVDSHQDVRDEVRQHAAVVVFGSQLLDQILVHPDQKFIRRTLARTFYELCRGPRWLLMPARYILARLAIWWDMRH